jgi:hypothetical protein
MHLGATRLNSLHFDASDGVLLRLARLREAGSASVNYTNHLKELKMDLLLITAAFLGAGVFGACAKFARATTARTIWIAVLTFFGSLVTTSLVQYLDMPSMVGYLGGCGYIIFWTTVAGLIASGVVAAIGAFFSRRSDSSYDSEDNGGRLAIAYGSVAALNLLLLIGWGITCAWFSWGKGNLAFYANNFANIEVAKPGDNLPPSNPDDFWYVPDDTAFAKAKQALAQDTRLATLFKITKEHMVAQSVAGHNVYIAPLEYQDWRTQFGIMGAAYAPVSPGYVEVDGSNPNAVAQLKTGAQYQMTYFPSASFGTNIERYVYNHGYSDGKLDDPTLEVDDSGHPYFTITFNKYKRVVKGEYIDKVLIVDAQTGKIDAYEPGAQPKWVDRVVSARLITKYVNDWLRFGWKKDALPAYSIFFGGSSDQFKILDQDMVYNTSDRPTEMITVTSNDSSNDAVVAVIAYDLYRNHGVIYPSLAGVQPSSHAVDALKAKIPNSARNWDMANIHLYYILGHLTWSCVYVSGDTGSVVGVGFVDATPGKTQASNAVFGVDKRSALAEYSRRLMQEQTGNNGGLAGGKTQYQTVSGIVYRIGRYELGGNTLFNISLSTDGTAKGLLPHYYTADPQAVYNAQFVREGDNVTVEFESIQDADQLLVHGVTDGSLKGLSAPAASKSASTQPATTPAPAQ